MKNNILDIKGIEVGHAQNEKGKTGVTVILTKQGAVCGVDVRGAAPGTRETDLLNPTNSMEKVHAVVLSGGSAYGLASADGVMAYLEKNDIGFDVGVAKVPIVPAAVLFDLGVGDPFCRPDKEMGMLACENASATTLLEGSVGAGCGASVGKLRGAEGISEGGIGSFAIHRGDICMSALIAVNAFGDVVENDTILAGTKNENNEFIDTEQTLLDTAADVFFEAAYQGKNTTIGVIATNVKLTKAEATKIASMAHNGLARSIRPVHTTMDGDTIFCLSTGEIVLDPVPVDLLGIMAVRAVETAVHRGVTMCER
ncbi:MAG: P1 family peptidase [Bacillota bacterium]